MSQESGDDAGAVRLRTAYVGTEDLQILLATDFVIQYHRGLFILNIAQAAPPILLGPPERSEDLPVVPIRVITRVAMSEDRLRALVGVLQGHLERFGTQGRGELEPGEDEGDD